MENRKSNTKLTSRNKTNLIFHKKKFVRIHQGLSNSKKQLMAPNNQQYYLLPTIKAQNYKTQRKPTLSPLIIDNEQENVQIFTAFCGRNYSKTPKGQKYINKETDINKKSNRIDFNQTKTSFKIRKIHGAPLETRMNIVSFLTPRHKQQYKEHQFMQRRNFHNENYKNEKNYLIENFTQTCLIQRNSCKKSKQKKCLIAANSKKLPFSLQKNHLSNKRKENLKTNHTIILNNEGNDNIEHELFELDVSIILNHQNQPDTPFMRMNSYKKLEIEC